MSSKETHLTLHNYTANELRVTVSHVTNYDWDGNSRPDKNFQGVLIPAFGSHTEREEVNANAHGTGFMLTLTFTNGVQISIPVDQDDALHNSQKRITPRGSTTPVQVFQSGDGSTNSIVVLPTISPKAWMAGLPDTLSLSAINIPGTHETCAVHFVGSPVCQTMSVPNQLDAGIRFMDIRLRLNNGQLKAYHAFIPEGTSLQQIQQECMDFLATHPTECIVLLVKRAIRSARIRRPSSRSSETTRPPPRTTGTRTRPSRPWGKAGGRWSWPGASPP